MTQLQLPSLVFTGPVDTTITGPLARLDSGTANTNTHTFVTPAGNLTLQRTSNTMYLVKGARHFAAPILVA